MGHNLKNEDSDDERWVLNVNSEVLPGRVPMADKQRLYKLPDFAFIILKDSKDLIIKDLSSLIERGGVYYEIFERDDEETLLVVLFFEDSILDCAAEVMQMKT